MNKTPNLYVDLDHTLLKTDVLQETVMDLFFNNFWFLLKTIFSSTSWLKIKSKLSRNCFLDLRTFKKNTSVISLIEDHRKIGGKIILATAAHKKLASFFSKEFDDVIASSDFLNAKGEEKLKLIRKHCKNKDFFYAGDSSNDIVIFKKAKKAYVVGSVDYNKANAYHLKDDSTFFPITFKNCWRNLFFLFFPIFSNNYSFATIYKSIIAFLFFTLIRFSFENLKNIKNRKPGDFKAFPLFIFCSLSIFISILILFCKCHTVYIILPGMLNLLDLLIKTKTH